MNSSEIENENENINQSVINRQIVKSKPQNRQNLKTRLILINSKTFCKNNKLTYNIRHLIYESDHAILVMTYSQKILFRKTKKYI